MVSCSCQNGKRKKKENKKFEKRKKKKKINILYKRKRLSYEKERQTLRKIVRFYFTWYNKLG